MNHLETITTKVRPIKKLFLVEPNDHATLADIVKLVSTEIWGLSNLMLVNDDDLFNEDTLRFINRHDPDVIVNYSNRADADLQQHFRTCTYSKKADSNIARHFSTPMSIWSAVPPAIQRWRTDDKPIVYSTHHMKSQAISYLYSLHYGVIDKHYGQEFELSLFDGVQVKRIPSMRKFFELFFDSHETNLLHLTGGLSISSGDGTSVWEINYNPDELFHEKPTLILSKWDDLRSIAYFWNMRATYPYNKTLWFPIELWDTPHRKVISQYIDRFEYVCRFDGASAIFDELKQLRTDVQEVNGSKYYFRGYRDEWKSFEYTQVVPVVDGSLRVTHPSERLFSNDGFNINLVLEVRGIQGAILPSSPALGELFVPNPAKQVFPHYFRRISRGALVSYVDNFHPMEDRPIYEEIRLPNDEEVFQALFGESGLTLKPTIPTKLVKQALFLLGGTGNIVPLCNPQIAKLLVDLTPKRSDRIARDLIRNLPTCSVTREELFDFLQVNLPGILLRNSDLIMPVDEMTTKLQISETDILAFYHTIQRLYESGVLLRGKHFLCPHCHTKLWLALDAIQPQNRCYACNQAVNIPIHQGAMPLGDHVRLNELMIGAVDQGVLPVLCAMHLLYAQQYYGTRFLSNYEIYSDGDTRVCEADLIFTLGKRLGLAEVKAHRGFDDPQGMGSFVQIERMVNVARQVRADLLLFGTLLRRDSPEVRQLIDFLDNKSLGIPAFIATGETLLDERRCNLFKYFELERFSNRFKVGPIILEHLPAHT